MRPEILIIEDEPAIADTIVYALKTEGFSPRWCATGESGLKALRETNFALLVLDIGLPDGSGFDFYRKIRVSHALPVLFLSARSGEMDRVLGLELGGDDYLVKPFSPRELTARIRAVLRRTAPVPPDPALKREKAGPSPMPAAVEIDEHRCCIRFHGTALALTRYEFRLARALATQPGRVFTRDQLLDSAWEEPGSSSDRTVDAHIKTLRAKMRTVAPQADPIQTHRGLGYSWRET